MMMISPTCYVWLQWATSNGHVIGQNSHYDVIDFVYVAKRRGHKINDVKMTIISYPL